MIWPKLIDRPLTNWWKYGGLSREFVFVYGLRASLCGSVGKDFVYHAFGHEFKSRLT